MRSSCKKTQCLLVVALWIFTATPQGAAGVIIIPTPDLASRGWYDFTGYHDSTNDNYVVGNAEDGPYRNFFVFALPVLQPGESISSIDLILYCPPGFGYNSSDPTETYQLFTLENTTIAALRAGGDGLTNIFADLGEGEAYNAGFLLSAGNAGTDRWSVIRACVLSHPTGLRRSPFRGVGPREDRSVGRTRRSWLEGVRAFRCLADEEPRAGFPYTHHEA
jgi:hypothetical protein